ncbi:MAG TPA: hypothetical protein VGD24_08560 [Gallionella sp.]
MAPKTQVGLAILVAYVMIYGLLRITHVVIHGGAFYENGIKKFYDHRMQMESTYSLLLPTTTATVMVFSTPAMALETIFWHYALPVSGQQNES